MEDIHALLIINQNGFFQSQLKNILLYEFTRDILRMNDNDIIINMSAELYKLNDIIVENCGTNEIGHYYAFSGFLIVIACCLFILFLVTVLWGD